LENQKSDIKSAYSPFFLTSRDTGHVTSKYHELFNKTDTGRIGSQGAVGAEFLFITLYPLTSALRGPRRGLSMHG